MTAHGVWAVITAFRPHPALVDEVISVASQVNGVVVVDDGSGPSSDAVAAAIAVHGATVIRLATNSGIAVALNAGIRAAIDAGASAVVTFDQDSHIESGFVDSLVRARDAAIAAGVPVGLVVPEHFADVRQAHGTTREGILFARRVIQSGMLLDRSTIEDIGGMWEPLFIDLVDTEYELRCLSHGLIPIAAPGLRLTHSLGARFRRRGRLPLPAVPRIMTLSSPFRYYYRARNRVLIVRRHAWKHPVRLLSDTVTDAAYFGVVCVLARPRSAMWRILLAGTGAGARGIGGRIPPDVEALASTVRWAADRID